MEQSMTKGKEYSESYRHFDTLIWQTPTWSTAVFTGVLVSAFQIHKDKIEIFTVTSATIALLLVAGGAIFLGSLAYTLFRFRVHQCYTTDKLATPFSAAASTYLGRLGAQSLLQASVCVQSAVLAGLTVYGVVAWLGQQLSNACAIAMTLLFWLVPMVVFEVTVFKEKRRAAKIMSADA
jgi:hypothetical protein